MEAVHHRLARVLKLPVLDDADLEGGAAHVGGDHGVVAHQLAEPLRADHASGGAGLDHAHGSVRRGLGGQEAAVALHDHDGAGVAVLCQQGSELGQVIPRDAPGVGVDDGGGGALVLAEHGRDLAGERDVGLRRHAVHHVAHRALVRIVAKGPQEGDGDRLHALLLQEEAHRLLAGVLVEGKERRALEVDALRHADDAGRVDQGSSALRAHGVLDAVLGQPRPAARRRRG